MNEVCEKQAPEYDSGLLHVKDVAVFYFLRFVMLLAHIYIYIYKISYPYYSTQTRKLKTYTQLALIGL